MNCLIIYHPHSAEGKRNVQHHVNRRGALWNRLAMTHYPVPSPTCMQARYSWPTSVHLHREQHTVSSPPRIASCANCWLHNFVVWIFRIYWQVLYCQRMPSIYKNAAHFLAELCRKILCHHGTWPETLSYWSTLRVKKGTSILLPIT
jgi:hypothetical protein